MNDEKHPAAPTPDRMQLLAALIDGMLPPGYGFICLCAEMNRQEPLVLYVANVNQEDAKKIMSHFAANIAKAENYGKDLP